MRIRLLILLLCCLFHPAHAQQPVPDSLQQVLASGSDRDKQQALLQLVNRYRNSNPSQALPYIERLTEISATLGDEQAVAKANQLAGSVHVGLGNFARAKEYYTLALNYYTASHNPTAQYEVSSAIAGIYFTQGNLPAAAELYLRNLRHYEETNDKAALVNTLNALGSIYARQNNFSKAIDYNLRAIRIYEQLSDKFRTLVTSDNIGNIYLRQGNLLKAGEYFGKSLGIYRDMNNKAGMAATYLQLGNIAQQQNNHEKALGYYRSSLGIARSINIQPLQVSVLNAMARSYLAQKNFEKAEQAYTQSIRMARGVDMKIELEEAYQGMEEVYNGTREQSKARTFRKLSRDIGDSLYNDSSIKKLADLQLIYDTEKKQRKIELLSKEQEVNTAELRSEQQLKNFLLFSSIGLALVFVVLGIFFIRNKRIEQNLRRQKVELEHKNTEILAQKEQLGQLNNVKDRFFSIISHDLRNNLTTMKLYFDLVSHPGYEAADNGSVTKEISGSVENTIDLLENLLVWASAQIKGVPMHIQRLYMHSLVQENISLLAGAAHQKKISLVNEVPEEITAFADIDMINLVLRNLVSNAIKFTPAEGSIRISATQDEEQVYVHVADNGIGISSENLGRLFRQHDHPSTKGTGNEKGTGLGLLLCKDFVERNGGSISVESSKGKGSTFSFSLPRNTKDI